MKQQDINDPLKALRDELADVSPSPEFAARVRQGIDAAVDGRHAGWLSGWRWLVPAGAVAAVVVAVFAMSRPSEAPVAVVARGPIHTPAISPEPVRAPTHESPAKPPEAAARGRTAAKPGPEYPSTRAPAFALRASAGKPEDPRTREPELEVITNQAAILRALWARVDANAPLVESVVTTSPGTIPEIVVNPIEVSPIVIQWLGDPQTAPGAPVIRKNAADRAERSEK